MTPGVLANIDVEDLARATDFYTRAFELRVGRRLAGSIVELVGGPIAIYLLQKASGTPASERSPQRRDYARHWTSVHLDFVVPDIDAAVARAEAAGARREGPIRTGSWGRIAQFSDPFGNGFCLIQFLGRGYDEIAT